MTTPKKIKSQREKRESKSDCYGDRLNDFDLVTIVISTSLMNVFNECLKKFYEDDRR